MKLNTPMIFALLLSFLNMATYSQDSSAAISDTVQVRPEKKREWTIDNPLDGDTSIQSAHADSSDTVQKTPVQLSMGPETKPKRVTYNESPFFHEFTREQIIRSDASTLGELLLLLPGLSLHRNAFFAGQEEIRLFGLHIERIVAVIDGVPFQAKDLFWHNLPRWSPAAFGSIKVSTGAEKHLGRGLLIDLTTYKATNQSPTTDAKWQTGPFNTNLLDVHFSRHLGKTVTFYLSSRALSIASDQYSHPDVISTFYESLGKDTARMRREGFNPMQRVRDLRAGVELRLRNEARIFGNYSAMKTSDSVFLPKADTSILNLSGSQADWTQIQEDYGFYSIGIGGLPILGGALSAQHYRKSDLSNGICVAQSYKLGSTELKAGVNQISGDPAGENPGVAWAEATVNFGAIKMLSLNSFSRGLNKSGLSTRESIQLRSGAFSLFSMISYQKGNSYGEHTYLGMPVVVPGDVAALSLLLYRIRPGVSWKGLNLWLNFAREVVDGEELRFYLNRKYYFFPSESFSLGLGCNRHRAVQFGSTTSFLNENPDFEQLVWINLVKPAARGKMNFETRFTGRYTSRIQVPDFGQMTWITMGDVWDVDLKLSLQIKTFRLYYKIQNIFNNKSAYYPAYNLPGLNFMWGLHWTLKS